jgi:nucleoid DNA-binding protein
MNKTDLIESLTKVLSTRKEAKDAVEKVFEEIILALRNGDKVIVSGFGSFHPFTAKSKKCRNPKTGESIHISPRKKVRFHQSKDLF